MLIRHLQKPKPFPVLQVLKSGFPGYTVNVCITEPEQLLMPIKRCPGFYCFFFLLLVYGVRRSGDRRISWLSTWSQFRYLCVHFFVTFPLARYSIFSSALSLGNTLFVFVTFRYWRFSPSYDCWSVIHDPADVP